MTKEQYMIYKDSIMIRTTSIVLICMIGLLLAACGTSGSQVEQNDHAQQSNDPTLIDSSNHQGKELKQNEDTSKKDTFPDFIIHPTLTEVIVGDTTIVISRPIRHKNYTLKDDSTRLARDQVIKARIEKMTKEHPDWMDYLSFDPNYRYYDECFPLWDSNSNPYVYFEKSGKLMNVDKELAYIYPEENKIARCNQMLCEVKPEFIDQSVLEVMRINPHLRKKENIEIEEQLINRPYVSGLPNIASYQRVNEMYVTYSKRYYSDEGLIGAQGGVVVFDMNGDKILDYFDEEDNTTYIRLIDDDYFASLAMTDGHEGCNECLPYAIKIISRKDLRVVYKKVYPRSTDVKTTTDDVYIEKNQAVEGALIYRVINSYYNRVEYHLVDLSSLNEWKYVFKHDRSGSKIWNGHLKIIGRAYKKYSSGDIESFESLGFVKVNNKVNN